jgi:anthranilate phosphoribosyltransferase
VGLTDLGGWGGVLTRLTSGGDLTGAEATALLDEVLAGTATDAQIAAFLVALKMKGETPEEVEGFVASLLAHSSVVVAPEGAIDIVGTGGDRSGTVNVSTMASFVVAGAGVPVVKHGNRAQSSKVGAADVLEGLGVAIELDASGVETCIREAGMGFCFAQRFHPAMRFVGPVRRELMTPTIFNILGPLANPARPRRQLVGVADPRRARLVAEVLARQGSERATVVFADDGLDEITLTGSTTLVELERDGQAWSLTERRLDPRDFGFDLVAPSALVGGELDVNVAAVRAVLAGTAGPVCDVVTLNAAVALVDAGVVGSVDAGIERARAAIESGHAASVLDRLVEVSQACA